MKVTLRVWRQAGPRSKGRMVAYGLEHVAPDMSFLEALDMLNEHLILAGEDPVAFDHDCREGICGSCGVVIDGIAHGPEAATTTCQLYMRSFSDGDVIDVEPWRAQPFPIIQDLVVDRGAFDRIIAAGGFISAPTGAAADARAVPVSQAQADHAFDAATCIGCGACVAACPNGSAMLFAGAKITHLGLMPQGQTERNSRALEMIAAHDAEGFGGCTQIGECTAVCPKSIQLDVISRFDHDVLSALLRRDP